MDVSVKLGGNYPPEVHKYDKIKILGHMVQYMS